MSERIELLDELGVELARVAGRAERQPSARSALRRLRRPRRPRALAVAVGIVAVLAGAAFAVPQARTAVGGVAGSFTAWVLGDDGAAPGRALRPGDDVPRRFRALAGDAHPLLRTMAGAEPRVLAQAEGVALYARRGTSDQGPTLHFSLGEALGWGGPVASMLERLDRNAVVILGHTPFGRRKLLDERGRVPLFGLTAPQVERVELRYAAGPPLAGDARGGGFVLLVDAWRPLRELVAYDAAGHVVQRRDVSRRNLRHLCERHPSCPPRPKAP